MSTLPAPSTVPAVDPLTARKTWRTVEPLHGMIYFTPEADEGYAAAGIKGNMTGYFASRSAAFGTPSAEVVIATFYNFYPSLVRRCIPAAWDQASPADVLAARVEAVGRALTRLLGPEAAGSSDVAEAAGLARTAAEAATSDLAGRPLFAAHAALEWPTQPLLALWQAQTLQREYRGDGHIAALVTARLDPVEALIVHSASGEIPVAVLKATRAWPEVEWDAGVARLAERGLVTADGAALTEAGKALHQRIEDQTDASAVKAYAALGEEGCSRLRTLTRPLSQAVVAGGGLNPDPSRFDR